MLGLELAGVPAAAQGLDQPHGRVELLAAHLGRVALRRQPRFVRDDHIGVVGLADQEALLLQVGRLARGEHRLLQRGIGPREIKQIGQRILHVAHRIEHGAAVTGHRLVVAGARLLQVGKPLPAVEERDADLRPVTPDRVRPGEEVGCPGAEIAARTGEGDAWEKSGVGDADGRVAGGHCPFRFRDVGTPLQQRSGHTCRYERRPGLRRQRGRRQDLVGGIHPAQHGERVLRLRPALLHLRQRRLGIGQVGLRLGHVDIGRTPRFHANLVDANRFCPCLHRVAQDADFRIVFAQREVLDRDIALQGEQHVLVIGQRSLGLRVRGLEGTANASPEIDLIAEIDRHVERIVRLVALENTRDGNLGELRIVLRQLGARVGGSGRERGEKRRALQPGAGPRFVDARHRGLEVLVFRGRLRFEIVEIAVVKKLPPWSLGQIVARLRLFPMPVHRQRRGHGRTSVVGPDGTTGEEKKQEGAKKYGAFHEIIPRQERNGRPGVSAQKEGATCWRQGWRR